MMEDGGLPGLRMREVKNLNAGSSTRRVWRPALRRVPVLHPEDGKKCPIIDQDMYAGL